MPLFYFAMFVLLSAMAFAAWEMLSVNRMRKERDRRIPTDQRL